MTKNIILFFAVVFFAYDSAFAGLAIQEFLKPIEEGFTELVNWLFANTLFYEIKLYTDASGKVIGFPIIVLWMFTAAVFFTFKMGFINFKLFKHAIQVVLGKFDSDEDVPGEVTHFQALSAAISATVGLGNIAGVAVAVSAGGPGAVIWMVIAGFFGMTLKFSEITLGLKYREIDEKGKVLGGAFRYLEYGLKELNYAKLGRIMAIIFAVCCIFGAFGAGSMFQANQSTAIIIDTFDLKEKQWAWIISSITTVLVAVILIGGIKRIAHVAEAIVPFMAALYIISAFIIIGVNIEFLPEAVKTMFKEAFNFSAVGGGALGALVQGFRRATFSNEAGLGSAPTAHAAAKTNEPIREGCVGLLGPFIDTVVICFITGIMITITGVYKTTDLNGVELTSAAFGTVSPWFPILLTLCISLFAFSTMITWSYYGEKAWQYLFGRKAIKLYIIIYCFLIFFGGMIDFGIVLQFTDLLVFAMAVPNIICLYMMRNIIKNDLQDYVRRLKAGEFKKVTTKQQKSKT